VAGRVLAPIRLVRQTAEQIGESDLTRRLTVSGTDDVAGLIEEVRTILEPARLSFGYRPRDAACLYMWHWKKDKLETLLPYKTALDYCIHDLKLT
jgi:hypothetical protein